MCASIEELNRKWSNDIAEKFIESDDPIKKLLGYNTLAITAVHCELEDHIKVCKKAELAAIEAKVAVEPPNALQVAQTMDQDDNQGINWLSLILKVAPWVGWVIIALVTIIGKLANVELVATPGS